VSAFALDQVQVVLDDVLVLDDVSCALDAQRIAVVGENGSGKSTFARLVGGLIPPAGGRIRVLGLDPVKQAKELRRRIAFVFSNPDAQIIMPTVAEDVAFSLRSQRLGTDESTRRVREAIEHFGLADLADRPAHSLSGGQKQLLALCGAFVRRPELVIADEPTAYLDARHSRRVADHLFADLGHRLLLVTHDLDLARRCEVALHFADGRLVSAGPAATVVPEYEASLV
jgi:biotin transport system ATP-binding protein